MQLVKIYMNVYRQMSVGQRIFAFIFGLVVSSLSIVAIIYHKPIFAAIGPLSKTIREIPGGWLIFVGLISLVSFPPMIGYVTSCTLCGLVYGMWNGWLIATLGTFIGSTLAFMLFRYFLIDMARKFAQSNSKFAAFSLTLEYDGIFLLWLMRLSPLPFSLSNAAISSIPSAKLPQFIIATLLACPKLLIHTFVGSRIAAFGDDLSNGAKILNTISIIVGIIIGAVAAFIIYRKTIARMVELEEEHGITVDRELYNEILPVNNDDPSSDTENFQSITSPGNELSESLFSPNITFQSQDDPDNILGKNNSTTNKSQSQFGKNTDEIDELDNLGSIA